MQQAKVSAGWRGCRAHKNRALGWAWFSWRKQWGFGWISSFDGEFRTEVGRFVYLLMDGMDSSTLTPIPNSNAGLYSWILPKLHLYKFMLVGSRQVYSYIFAQKTIGTNLYPMFFQSLIHTVCSDDNVWPVMVTPVMLGPHWTLPIAPLGYHYGLPFQLARALGVACFCQVWRMPGKGPAKKRCFVHLSSLLWIYHHGQSFIISGNVLTLGEPSFLFISLDLWNREIWIWVGWIQHAA